MKLSTSKLIRIACVTLLVLGVGLASASPAQAAPLYDEQSDCVADGGTWTYEGLFLGIFDMYSCSYPAGSSGAVAACGAGFDATLYYLDIIGLALFDTVCNAASGSGPSGGGGVSESYPPYGSTGAQTNGPNDEAVTLCLTKGKNGCVTFPAGACPNNCTISTTLPAAAADALPAGALAKLYVRPIDENGEPSASSYTVCFDNPDGEEVVIYKFAGGAWVALTFSSTADQICTTSSGEGAFYLG